MAITRRIREAFKTLLRGPSDRIATSLYTWPGSGYRYRPTHSTIRTFPRWFNSWVFICADKNATAIANQTLRLYNRQPSDTRKRLSAKSLTRSRKAYIKAAMPRNYTDDAVEIETHPFLKVLDRPNPLLDRCGLMWLTAIYGQIAGEAFWYLASKGGELSEIWPLPSQYVTPLLGEKSVFDSYELRYGGRIQQFPVESIVHFRPKPSPVDTLSAWGNLRGVLEIAESNVRMKEYQRALFDNMAVPDYVISPKAETNVDQVERLETSWRAMFKGWMKRGQVAVAPFPMEVQELQFSNRDLQFKDGTLAARDEIAAGFGVPISVIQSDSSTFSNMRHGLELWARNTLAPLAGHVCEKINNDVLGLYAPNESDEFYGENPWFVCFDDFVPEDVNDETDRAVKLVQAGIESPNMALRRLKEEPVAWGEEPWLPSGLRTPSQLVAEAAGALELQRISGEVSQLQAIPPPAPDEGLGIGLDRAQSVQALTNALQTALTAQDVELVNMIRATIAAQLGQEPPADLTEEDVEPEPQEGTNDDGKPKDDSQDKGTANAAKSSINVPAGGSVPEVSGKDGGSDLAVCGSNGNNVPIASTADRPEVTLRSIGFQDFPESGLIFSKSAPMLYAKIGEFLMTTQGNKEPFQEMLSRTFEDFEQTVIANLGELTAKKKIKVAVEVLYKRSEWIERFMRRSFPYLKIAFDRGMKAGGADLEKAGIHPELMKPDRAMELLEKYTRKWCSAVVDLTGEQLSAALRPGLEAGESMHELAKRVGEVYGDKKDKHAELIARTEINTAINAGAALTWSENGVKQHRWETSVDACEFCESLSGKVVDIGKAFVGKGDTLTGSKGGHMMVSWRTVLHPTLHPRCVCTLVPIIPKE